LILLVNLFLEFKGGKLATSWALFAIGVFFYWLSDVLYAIYHESYEAQAFFYRQLDYFWIIGYLLMGYSLFMQGEIVAKLKEHIRQKRAKEKSGR